MRASTLAKWLLNALKLSGVDTAVFRAHSTRAASSSDLALKGFSVSQIMKRADWSRAKTFQTFYNRS